jgi:hypothetical protein
LRQRFAGMILGGSPAERTSGLAALAVTACELWRLLPCELAILAPDDAGARILARAIAGPEADLAEAFYPEQMGSVDAVAYLRSDEWPLITPRHRRYVVDEFVALQRRVADVSDDNPDGRRWITARKIEAAEVLDLVDRARRLGHELLTVYAELLGRGRPLPAPGLCLEIADFYDRWKRRERITDIADVWAGPLRPLPDCPLVLVDDADLVPPLARMATARVFPRAAYCLANVAEPWPELGALAVTAPLRL